MADSEEKEVILDIQVKYSDAINGISNYQKKVDDLKKSNDELKKSLKEGSISEEEYRKEVAANKIEMDRAKESIRALEKEIRNNIKAENEQKDSLISLRAQLSNLIKEFDSLSESERNGAKGKELQEKINNITNSLLEAEEATGRFQRNVGNYEQAMQQAIASTGVFGKSMVFISTAGKSAGGVIGTITSQIKAFTAALIANPLITILTIVIALLAGLKKIIDSNEETTARWSAIIAPLNRLLQSFVAVLQNAVNWLLKGAEAFQNIALAGARLLEKLPLISKFMKGVNDETKKSIDLEKEKYALEQKTRNTLVENAKNERDIAKLRTQANDKSTYSAKERLKFIQDANKLEKESADRSLDIAKERLMIAEEEASRTKNKKSTEQQLAQLRADVYKAETDHYNKIRELKEKENSFNQEIKNQEKSDNDARIAAGKEYQSKLKEQKDKEIEAIRQAEDSALTIVKDGIVKQRQIVNLNYTRQIDDLKRKLSNENNLTKAAREAINKTIINLEKERQIELDKLSDENNQKLIDKEIQRIDLLLSSIKEGSEYAYQLRLQQLAEQEKSELAANDQLEESLQQSSSDIRAKYSKLIDDEIDKRDREILNKQSQAIRLEWDNRLLAAQNGSLEEYNLKTQAAQAEYDFIVNLDSDQKAVLYESDLAYTNALLQNKKKLEDAEKAQQAAIMESVAIQLQAAQEIGSGFEDVLNAFAEDNESLAAFAKTVALFNVGLSTAEAIAKGTAAAQSVPFPGNLAAIATTIASVLSNIAKAKQLISKESTPTAPSFSTGGNVSGPGSGTSDSIVANLSHGESILAAQPTSMFGPILSAFNQIGGGVPINTVQTSNQVMGEDMLARAFAKGVSFLPAPVVSVEEINNVDTRVSVLENLRVQ